MRSLEARKIFIFLILFFFSKCRQFLFFFLFCFLIFLFLIILFWVPAVFSVWFSDVSELRSAHDIVFVRPYGTLLVERQCLHCSSQKKTGTITLKLWQRDHNNNYKHVCAESIATKKKIGYGDAVDNVELTNIIIHSANWLQTRFKRNLYNTEFGGSFDQRC